MSNPLILEDLVVDCSANSRTEAIAEVHRKLDVERAALLRNTGMARLSEMAAWAELLDLQQMDYTGGTGHREPMGSGVLSVGIEPHYTNIEPHCEMSFWTYYPRYLLFGCVEIPATGGETVIADNRRVTEDIWQTETGQRIFENGVRYIRNFSDADKPDCIPSTKSWQEAFEFTDWGELENFCVQKDWQLVQREDGSAQVSYPEVGFEYDPRTEANLLFTSMARLGRAFDDWPPYNNLPNDQRPYHVTYADGSEFSSADLDTLDRIFARYSIPIPWQPGDIAVLDNITWPHARPPYRLRRGEQRRIGVLVSEPVQRRRIVLPPDH